MEKFKTIHWIIFLFSFAIIGMICMILDIKLNNTTPFQNIFINSGMVIGIIGGLVGAIGGFIKLGE